MTAPSFLANLYSSAVVTLDVNMMPSFENPDMSASINSVKDEQSTPHPSSLKILRIDGFGVDFTAKNS